MLLRNILALLLLLSASVAQAMIKEPPNPSLLTHTIEALTTDSPIILVATVDRQYAVGGHKQIDIHSVNTLKAPPGFTAPLPLSASFKLQDEPTNPWPKAGSTILIFLGPDRFNPTVFQIYDFVPLDASTPIRSAMTDNIYDLTMSPLTDTQKVFTLVQQEVQRTHPTTTIETFDTYPFQLANLPADNRLLPAARKWALASDPLPRYLAALVMKNHPDPQDIPLLRSLLQDPYSYDIPFEFSPWSGHEYLIRQTAAQTLSALSASFPPPVLATPRNDLYQPFSLLWAGALLILPPVLFVAARRVFHRKHRPQQITLAPSAIASLTFFCVYTALLTAILWYQSNETVEDVMYARNQTSIEITSIRGILIFAVGTHFPAETSPVHLSFNMATIHRPPSDPTFYERPAFGPTMRWGDIWDMYNYHPIKYQLMPGVAFRHSITATLEPFSRRSGSPITYPARTLYCSHVTIVLALLALPIFRLLAPLFSKFRRALRARRLQKIGLCRACAYDLRAHHPGDCCPECGTTITQPAPFLP